jgi:hypothetical protein
MRKRMRKEGIEPPTIPWKGTMIPFHHLHGLLYSMVL